jgi:hypothetical protein
VHRLKRDFLAQEPRRADRMIDEINHRAGQAVVLVAVICALRDDDDRKARHLLCGFLSEHGHSLACFQQGNPKALEFGCRGKQGHHAHQARKTRRNCSRRVFSWL